MGSHHVTQDVFKLMGSSDTPASASLVAEITGNVIPQMHHTQLIFVCLRDGFHHVGQAGFEILP